MSITTSRSGAETTFNDFKLTYSKGDVFSVYVGQLSGAFLTGKGKCYKFLSCKVILLHYQANSHLRTKTYQI